jgi:hypothetical protein
MDIQIPISLVCISSLRSGAGLSSTCQSGYRSQFPRYADPSNVFTNVLYADEDGNQNPDRYFHYKLAVLWNWNRNHRNRNFLTTGTGTGTGTVTC